MRLAPGLITSALLGAQVLAYAAQAPARSTAPAQTNVSTPAALTPVTAMMQPALGAVQRTLNGVRLEKWKKGNVRDEASQNIGQIQRDIQETLPTLMRTADAAPGTLSTMLPVSRNVAALYDVLLRVVEASRVSAPDDQVEQLQQALVSLGNARLALGNQMQSSAEAMEKQVADLRATMRQQAAQPMVVQVPVVLPCGTTPHRAARKTTKAPTTPQSGNKTNAGQPVGHP